MQPIPGDDYYDRTSNILIIDDDDSLLKFFKIHLNKFFSRVRVVPSVREGLDLLQQESMDLIITDLVLPRADGVSFLNKVRKLEPSIPVLLISGASESDPRLRLIDSFDGFLAKPFGVSDFHSYIKNGLVLRGRLLALSQLLREPKKIRAIISGQTTKELSRLLLDPTSLAQAQEILASLQSRGDDIQAA